MVQFVYIWRIIKMILFEPRMLQRPEIVLRKISNVSKPLLARFISKFTWEVGRLVPIALYITVRIRWMLAYEGLKTLGLYTQVLILR